MVSLRCMKRIAWSSGFINLTKKVTFLMQRNRTRCNAIRNMSGVCTHAHIISVCVCVCVCVYIYIYTFIYIYIHLFICIYLFIHVFLISEFGVASTAFLLLLIYFPSKPKIPPSITASVERVNFKHGLMKLLR